MTILADIQGLVREAKNFSFPQQSAPLSVGERGIASLTHGSRTFRFRTNPNEFAWNYQLIKRVDPTYGGRVVQLLGVNIGDFDFKVEIGAGRWPYMHDMMSFLRDVMIDQRNGIPVTFEYTTRGWKLNCYITSFPFQDQVEVASQEIEIKTKVQEDVSGLMSNLSLTAELQRLQDGIGWQRSKYNDPIIAAGHEHKPGPGVEPVDRLLGNLADQIGGYVNNPFGGGQPINDISQPGGLGSFITGGQ